MTFLEKYHGGSFVVMEMKKAKNGLLKIILANVKKDSNNSDISLIHLEITFAAVC